MADERPRPRPRKAEPPAAEQPAAEQAAAEQAAAEQTPAAKPARSTSPAAAAASRARRIGGRPSGTAARQPVRREEPAGGEATRPVKPAKPAKPARRKRAGAEVPGWLRWLPAGVLSAGAVAMVVLLIVFSHGVWWAKPSGNAERDRVLAAAKTCVAKTNTYTYTALDKYRKQVQACTTGALTGQIDKTIDSLIKKYAPTLKAKQTAQINKGGIEAVSGSGDQWTLVVFGQLSVTNSNYPSGRTDPFAAQVRMQKVRGKWLMSGLQTVSTPVS
jgi:hypothetical protein